MDDLFEMETLPVLPYSIINHYVRFVDRSGTERAETGRQSVGCVLNGQQRAIKLTTKTRRVHT